MSSTYPSLFLLVVCNCLQPRDPAMNFNQIEFVHRLLVIHLQFPPAWCTCFISRPTCSALASLVPDLWLRFLSFFDTPNYVASQFTTSDLITPASPLRYPDPPTSSIPLHFIISSQSCMVYDVQTADYCISPDRTAVKRAQAKLKSRSSLPASASGTGTGTSASPSTSTTAPLHFLQEERHGAAVSNLAADVDELADDNDDDGPAPSAKDSRAGSLVAAPAVSRSGGPTATESMSVAALLEVTASDIPSPARPAPPQRTNSSGPPAASSGAATPAPAQPTSRPSTPGWAPGNSHAHPRQPVHPHPHPHAQPTPYWQMYPPHMGMGMGMGMPPPPMMPHPGMMHPAAMYYGRPAYPSYPPALGGGGKKAGGGHANANVELLRRQSAPSLAQSANGSGTGNGTGPAWSRTPSLVSSSSTLSTSTSGSGASLSPPSPSVVSDTLSTSTVTGSNAAARTKARTRPGTNSLRVSADAGEAIRGGGFGRSVSLGSGSLARASGGGARKHAKLWEHLPSSPPDDRPHRRRGSHSPPSSDSSDSSSDSDSDDDEGRAGKDNIPDGKDTTRRRSTGANTVVDSELALERAFIARAGPRTLEWACARDRVRGVRREDVGSESESDGEGRVGEKRRRTSVAVPPAPLPQRQQVPQVHVTAPTNGSGTGGATAQTVWDSMPGVAGGSSSSSSRAASGQPPPSSSAPAPARTETKQEERSPEMQEMALLLVDLRRKR